MGIIAFYVNKFEEGKSACLVALKTEKDRELNQKNLQFYLDEEKKRGVSGPSDYFSGSSQIPSSISSSIPSQPRNPDETKVQFINRTVNELKTNCPKADFKTLEKRAVLMWKKRGKKEKP